MGQKQKPEGSPGGREARISLYDGPAGRKASFDMEVRGMGDEETVLRGVHAPPVPVRAARALDAEGEAGP